MPTSRAPRARRSWGQRLLITFNAMAVLAAAIAAGTLAYANKGVSDISRVALSNVLETVELEEGDPLNILVVGVDDASGLAEDDPARNRSAADMAGEHTDTIMVLRLDPGAGTAQLLSFPRDLWVPIAGTSTNQRINAALSTGGPSRLIETITQDFGIPIHHYVQVDFAGFGELVELIDGVPVHFPHPVRAAAQTVELDIPEAGCWQLGPRQALGFARARKDYQVQDADGRWHLDRGGDFSRVERQQLLIQLALQRAVSKGARNPNTLRRLIDLGTGSVRLDDSLEAGDLVNLGIQFRSFDPNELQTFTLPVTDGSVGGAQILYLQEEEAEPILTIFRGVASVGGVSPADVRVQVLNGTGTRGQGSDVTGQLVRAGFDAIVPDDAAAMGQPTTIRHAAGSEAAAHLVARYVAGSVRYEETADLGGVDIVLVTGADWMGVAPTPKAVGDVQGPTTTTTTTTTTAPDPAADPDPDGPDGLGAEGEEGEAEDPNDPRTEAFFRAQAPPPGASCTPTP